MPVHRVNRCHCCPNSSAKISSGKMTAFTAIEHSLMARALRLAQKGLTTAHPNPRVGCVLSKNGVIIGEGWHEKTGSAHAEINALQKAGSAAADCSAFVTLEPCSHQGRTPPCTDALIDARVAEVICAMQDPNPAVSGSGLDALRNAGIRVRAGLMESAALAVNEGFVSRMRRGRPFVRLKTALGLDGGTAMRDGESQWITGSDARRDVQRLRATSGALMTGVATALADNPRLTVRDAAGPATMQPIRVVLDSRLRLPPDTRMLAEPGRTIVMCIDDTRHKALLDAGAEVVRIADSDGRPNLLAVLETLADYGVNDLLVEAGPTLTGSLLSAQLVDELVIYQAPHIMGSQTRRMADTPEWQTLGQKMTLDIVDVRRIGTDMRITARPVR